MNYLFPNGGSTQYFCTQLVAALSRNFLWRGPNKNFSSCCCQNQLISCYSRQKDAKNLNDFFSFSQKLGVCVCLVYVNAKGKSIYEVGSAEHTVVFFFPVKGEEDHFL